MDKIWNQDIKQNLKAERKLAKLRMLWYGYTFFHQIIFKYFVKYQSKFTQIFFSLPDVVFSAVICLFLSKKSYNKFTKILYLKSFKHFTVKSFS
jgi:hypothetical protein